MFLAKWINKLRKYLPQPRHFKDTKLHRLLGNTIFRRELWQFKPPRMAGGVAVGLFVAFTPPTGVQMFIAAGLCMLLRVNLPLGVAATWTTNYFTSPFLYYFCYYVGTMVLGQERVSIKEILQIIEKFQLAASLDIIFAIIVGGLLTGIVAAFIGYWLVLWLATLERRSRLIFHLRMRLARKKRLSQKINV